MPDQYDIVIVGGGLVGASLAVALAKTDFRIALIEATEIKLAESFSYDERSTALGFGSRKILESMGVWQSISPDAEPILAIHVSQKGYFGTTRLSAAEQHLPALGYVVPNRVTGSALYAQMSKQRRLDVIVPARVERVITGEQSTKLEITRAGERSQISTRLLVAADGAGSGIRNQLGIPTRQIDYRQHALIANITPELPHQNQAYERFTAEGPVALLPLTEGRCSLVWTLTPEASAEVMALSDEAFLRALQQHFGYRLGFFQRVGERQNYPLSLQQAKRMTAQRGLLIGNAAHTIHPIAGQGFNLALRDVAVLAELLQQADDPGRAEILQTYATQRSKDITQVVRFTDGLLRLYTNPSRPLAHLRGASLSMLGRSGFLKRQLARRGMGLFNGGLRLEK
ncbi:MAG TPA: 2-octaprenyl-6-methoxyphenyl hydroxylase [Chromatiales bacterium]|nr:2-octaprenyl-6-methoxyphenyl hydroxylase [Thiotrichales bacterium]HIP67911.1 2-octaprenyl-6-methoxyphenyl hydroxylase [Chromatiales bacterium]